MRILKFAIFFAALCETVLADVKSPEATARSVQKSDFLAKAMKSEKSTESWTYMFVFDNGTKAFINYATLNIPTSGKKIGCDISFQNFKGRQHSVGRQYPLERYTEDASKARISIKDEYIMEGMPGKGHRVLFSANKNGKFLLDVTFKSASAAKVPGNGKWKISGNDYGEVVLIPYGRVSGKIAYNEDTLEVKGYGYLEHTWQGGNATDIAKRAFNLSEATRGAYAGRIGISTDGEPFGYVLHKTSDGTAVLLPKKILEGDKTYSGSEFPKSAFRIVWKNSADTLLIDMSKPRQKFSMLENFDGWFAKKATKLMLGGEIFFWRGRSKSADGLVFDWSLTGF